MLEQEQKAQAVRSVMEHVEEYDAKGVSMPQLHHSLVKHLKKAGYPSNAAWPIAVEAVAIGCLKGETNLPKPGKKGETQKLGKAARARYCAAYKIYKSNHPKGTGYGKKRGKG